MESISLNSFVLLEHLAMLLTSTLAINCKLRNFLNKAIGIINFAKYFQNLIDDTMIWFLNSEGLSEPDFYGDLVYKLKKIVGSNNFSALFIEIISHYKKIGYNIIVLQPTACLLVNPITVGNFAFLFNCTPVVGTWCFGCLSGPQVLTCWNSFAPVFSFIYCWVLIFALSPCYILIYMFWEMMHW